MRIERAVFYNGRYEGVYVLIDDGGKLVWGFVNDTYYSSYNMNQQFIDAHIRLDLKDDRFQSEWDRFGKHYCIIGNIDFQPEDLQ